MNNGTCEIKNNEPYCICPNKWYGLNCEIPLTEESATAELTTLLDTVSSDLGLSNQSISKIDNTIDAIMSLNPSLITTALIGNLTDLTEEQIKKAANGEAEPNPHIYKLIDSLFQLSM